MNASEWTRIFGILSPIALLLVMGTAITLRSGIRRVRSWQDLRNLASNGTWAAVHLSAWILGLSLLQKFIGVGISSY